MYPHAAEHVLCWRTFSTKTMERTKPSSSLVTSCSSWFGRRELLGVEDSSTGSAGSDSTCVGWCSCDRY